MKCFCSTFGMISWTSCQYEVRTPQQMSFAATKPSWHSTKLNIDYYWWVQRGSLYNGLLWSIYIYISGFPDILIFIWDVFENIDVFSGQNVYIQPSKRFKGTQNEPQNHNFDILDFFWKIGSLNHDTMKCETMVWVKFAYDSEKKNRALLGPL